MLSKAASMVAGVLVAHFYSDGFFPISQAAWSWECTYYTGGNMENPVYMAVNATDGPTCADNSTLTCSCPSTPCEGMNAALPSNLACAGAGDDKGSSGCYKLHHTYGTPVTAHKAVAGQGAADQVANACGAADVVRVAGFPAGLAMLVDWGVLTNDLILNATPASAQECQNLCKNETECEFFTYNDQGASGGNYGYFRGLCVLHKALCCNGTEYSTYHGAISGPKSCDSGTAAASKSHCTATAQPEPAPEPEPEPSPSPSPNATASTTAAASTAASTTSGSADTSADSAYSSQILSSFTFVGIVLAAF